MYQLKKNFNKNLMEVRIVINYEFNFVFQINYINVFLLMIEYDIFDR